MLARTFQPVRSVTRSVWQHRHHSSRAKLHPLLRNPVPWPASPARAPRPPVNVPWLALLAGFQRVPDHVDAAVDELLTLVEHGLVAGTPAHDPLMTLRDAYRTSDDAAPAAVTLDDLRDGNEEPCAREPPYLALSNSEVRAGMYVVEGGQVVKRGGNTAED
ncbi:hypothetical protein AMAG_01099 [Allomyces macrogynus ATCC 38327]|uniref:Uncharacterized protein n=1 Tax=Allomyces macrogynus (strain ATCC 38327) TaxID=578462 RepID=A0A0L0RYE8_ALLM3|nr:hypothetical protein AMAG_01099 [Allomyces macrogynus ATCC 38327]|eukprot:KNE55180.1 hypothetical protein AMAG_01099 [Allomyces macrogynus ATCC 38327]